MTSYLLQLCNGVDDEMSSYLISGTTRQQKDLLHSLKDAQDILLYVEGPHRLWLHSVQQFYYTLRLSKEMVEGKHALVYTSFTFKRSCLFLVVHLDPVLGVCMCQPANQKILTEWMKALQETYPSLNKATIVYNIRTIEENTDIQLLESSL